MQQIILVLLFIICLGCTSSESKLSEPRKQPSPIVNSPSITAQQNSPTVWQEQFNRQQSQQNKKTQDEKYQQEQRSIYEQLQRDNFRRLNDSYKP